ncbi:hypothetical protein J2T57_001036 [Natronocella acetinitrilica]|uniref:DUF4150 domain-containing protein n=1 Tax=Natronocella acetinitrilica TaxID=414046 RepID=A0AAE3G202_9GAMM|nr:hypothetical protein [Natronocella acetinitrilica]
MFPASTKQAGQCFAFPDVCKTPSPGGPVPIPYPNIGMVMQVQQESTKVKFAGKGAVTKKSKMNRSQGDEAGTAGGVVSNQNMGPVAYKQGSDKVKVEGQPTQHLTAMTGHNGSNANMPAGLQVVPSQVRVLVGL